MGVDFLICKLCHSTFPDCGDYRRCADCWSKFCMACGRDFILASEDADEDEARTEPTNCPICTLVVVPDGELLTHAIALLGTTREALADQYREWKTQ